MSADEKIARIAAVPLFAKLHKRELRRVAELSTTIIVEAGRVLCREGSLGEDFFVIEDGRLSVAARGRQLAGMGPGDFFGELALLGHTERTATVVAETAARLLVIGRTEFEALLREEPIVAVRMLPAIGERMARIARDVAVTTA